MGGLLYKDFVAIRGKRFVWILILLTIIFTALRMIFPGTTVFFGLGAVTENGEIMNFMDVYFFLGEFLMIWMGCYYTNDLATKILQYDQKDKIRGYLSLFHKLCKLFCGVGWHSILFKLTVFMCTFVL